MSPTALACLLPHLLVPALTGELRRENARLERQLNALEEEKVEQLARLYQDGRSVPVVPMSLPGGGRPPRTPEERTLEQAERKLEFEQAILEFIEQRARRGEKTDRELTAQRKRVEEAAERVRAAEKVRDLYPTTNSLVTENVSLKSQIRMVRFQRDLPLFKSALSKPKPRP